MFQTTAVIFFGLELVQVTVKLLFILTDLPMHTFFFAFSSLFIIAGWKKPNGNIE